VFFEFGLCSSRGVIYTVHKHKCYDVKKILPEFPSPGYQFLVFFRSLWCKGKCSWVDLFFYSSERKEKPVTIQ
jgi:hypothetical protein